MKKILLSVIVSISFFTSLSAQIEKKDTKFYGAKKNDFSLCIGVLPVINFIGNMFNGTSSQVFAGFGDVSPNFFNGAALTGKYFITDRIPLTASVGVNYVGNRDYSYTDDSETKDNVKLTGSTDFLIMLGSQYLVRPGKRLQPVLGANLVYAFSNKGFEKFKDDSDTDSNYSHQNPSNAFGLICNLGVEFFISKSVSLSAIADLGLMTTISREKISEWDSKYSRVKSSQTKFLSGKWGGNLVMNFYF